MGNNARELFNIETSTTINDVFDGLTESCFKIENINASTFQKSIFLIWYGFLEKNIQPLFYKSQSDQRVSNTSFLVIYRINLGKYRLFRLYASVEPSWTNNGNSDIFPILVDFIHILFADEYNFEFAPDFFNVKRFESLCRSFSTFYYCAQCLIISLIETKYAYPHSKKVVLDNIVGAWQEYLIFLLITIDKPVNTNDRWDWLAIFSALSKSNITWYF